MGNEALSLPELVLNTSTTSQTLFTHKFRKRKTIHILEYNCKCTPGNAAFWYLLHSLQPVTGMHEKYSFLSKQFTMHSLPASSSSPHRLLRRRNMFLD